MDFLASIASTALISAASILTISLFAATIWHSSVYIGKPIGVLVSKLIPDESRSQHKRLDKLQQILGGLCGTLLVVAALIYETTVFGNAIEREDVVWTWWVLDVLGVVVKGYLEGLLAFGLVSGVVRVAGL